MKVHHHVVPESQMIDPMPEDEKRLSPKILTLCQIFQDNPWVVGDEKCHLNALLRSKRRDSMQELISAVIETLKEFRDMFGNVLNGYSETEARQLVHMALSKAWIVRPSAHLHS